MRAERSRLPDFKGFAPSCRIQALVFPKASLSPGIELIVPRVSMLASLLAFGGFLARIFSDYLLSAV